MKVTITNLSGKAVSTDVVGLQPGESKTLDLSPEVAYRAALDMKTLVDAGVVSVSTLEEPLRLDALEPGSLTTPVALADLSVTTGKLAAGAVTTAKLGALAVDSAALAAGAVTTAKLGALAVDSAALAAGAVTTAKLGALAVDSAALAAGAVTTAKLGALAVDTAALAAGAVTAAKVTHFLSTEQTGNGSPQNVAHGLSGTPSLVLVFLTAVASATDSLSEGAHDGTNAIVTASTGAKYKVLAIL